MDYVIFHDDLDGLISAVLYYYLSDSDDYTFMRMEHDDKKNSILDNHIFKNDMTEKDRIVVLDFSFDVDVMKELQEKVGENNFIWIDHHKSAIEDCEKANMEIRGLQDYKNKKSGAYLVWEYFSDEEPNDFIKAVSAFDIWDKNEHYMDGMLFNCFFKTLKEKDLNPTNTIWEQLITDDQELMNECVEQGELIFKYLEAISKDVIDSHSKVMEWEGMKCLVANAYGNGSLSFLAAIDIDGKVLDKKYEDIEALVTFGWTGSRWAYGMYHGPVGKKKNTDLSAIAKKYGGGGHPGACGFSQKELIF